LPGRSRTRILTCSIGILLCLTDIGALENGGNFWSIGFASLRERRLSDENRYLVHAIPLLLREELSLLRDHRLADEEKEAYFRFKKDREAREKQSQVTELKSLLDDQAFRLGGAEKQEQRRESYLKNRDDLQAILDTERVGGALARGASAEDALAGDTSAESPPSDSRPIVVKEEALGVLFEPPQHSPLEYARKKGIDLLIWGELEEIEGFLYLSLYAYHAVLGRLVFQHQDAGSREVLLATLPAVRGNLARTILGRDWANLSVSAEPPDALITINGSIHGTGRLEGRFLETGEATVEVHHPDYLDVEKTVRLEAYEEHNLHVALDMRESRRTTLLTRPTGADLYLDSIWIGRSPAQIVLPHAKKRLLIKKEGSEEEARPFLFLPRCLGGFSPVAALFVRISCRRRYRQESISLGHGAVQGFCPKGRDFLLLIHGNSVRYGFAVRQYDPASFGLHPIH
jgi:hypothetical protein